MKTIFLAALAVASAFTADAHGESAPFHPDLLAATGKLDRARGPELYAALRAVWDTWDRADPGQVEAVLASAEDDARLDPPARAYAGMLGAYARLRRGDTAAAGAKIKALGFVDHFTAIGPFDDEGKAGFDAVYGPESDFGSPIVPGRAESGKERPVRWRTVPDAFPYGYVDFESLVRPDKKICVYATTFVSGKTGPTGRDIGIWVGAAGAVKAFWNGAMVLSDSAERRFDVDRLAGVVHLLPGENNLTIKACNTESAPIVAVRLSDARGKPDPTLQTTNTIEASAKAAAVVQSQKKGAPARAEPGRADSDLRTARRRQAAANDRRRSVREISRRDRW